MNVRGHTFFFAALIPLPASEKDSPTNHCCQHHGLHVGVMVMAVLRWDSLTEKVERPDSTLEGEIPGFVGFMMENREMNEGCQKKPSMAWDDD